MDNELKRLADIVDGIISPEERVAMGIDPEDDSDLRTRAKQLVEADIARSMTLEPLVKMVSKKTLYPWQGKEADSEIAFNFESVMDAQQLYDFVVNTGLLEPGEIKLNVTEHQTSVHFMSHVMVTKPEVLQAALLAYYDYVEDGEQNDETFESLVQDLDEILTERVKVSGAPKGKKGNPFHNKETGKFSGGEAIASDDGGSFAVGKTKLKFAKSKKSKGGDTVVHFASTKHPCGRAARKEGKDIRCWDGKKGMGIRLAKVMGKRIKGEEITDDDLRGMLAAVDYINGMAALVEEELFEARLDISPYVNNHGAKPRGKGSALWMFGFDDKTPTNDKVFQFNGKLADAKKAALKAGKSAGARVVYLLP